MISQYVEAFILGNQAILTNVCLLPLYPGLVAFLAGNTSASQPKSGGRWLGLLVLAGILTMMLVVGYLLFAFNQSFGDVLPILLPIIYGAVLLMGILMLLGFNPFARIASIQTPILRNRFLTAYLYGLLLGPMTLPCTGPLITSAFLLGTDNFVVLADGLLYFLFFGLGFGWVLVVLPFLAGAVQRQFTRWVTDHYKLLTRFSGVILIFIAILGIVTEVLPNLA
jgi:cytochrome c-type biogenesis protein